MFKITLSDGTIIDNLIPDCDYLCSNENISQDLFTNNLANVLIEFTGSVNSDNDIDPASLLNISTGLHPYMKLVDARTLNGKFCFALKDMNEQDIRDMKINARLDYISMMTDIDI